MSVSRIRTSVTVTGHTQMVGLLGWPVEHTISPAMHNAAFAALGMDWCYVPFAVPPARLKEALRGVSALGLRGMNATVPHKQALVHLVDELSPEARAIGAVNTLLMGDKIRGHNTDASGFLRALSEAHMSEADTALILGAGGAARAVGYALLSRGTRLVILNRTGERATALASDLRKALPGPQVDASVLRPETLAACAPRVDLIVNTTIVGMSPQAGECPWPSEVAYPGSVPLFDLIYTPRETRLMALARQSGARAANGLGMLVHQGAEAFRLWTGTEPPVDAMREACQDALEEG